MKLSDRLKQRRTEAVADDADDVDRRRRRVASRPCRRDRPARSTRWPVLKRRAQEALFARLGTRLFDASLSEDQLHAYVVQELGHVLEDEKHPAHAARARSASSPRSPTTSSATGRSSSSSPTRPSPRSWSTATSRSTSSATGKLDAHRGPLPLRGPPAPRDRAHRRRRSAAASTSRRRWSTPASPTAPASNAIIPPLAIDGPALTIRKFAKQRVRRRRPRRLRHADARSSRTFLAACVQGRLNILVSGGTGTGKTTLLNVLSSFIPDDERIVTIEDAAELQLQQRHVVRLESRPPNIEGRGEVTARDLVRNALRMRPDRIIVGEVRGGEALDMLQAMNTGHDGSLSTLHANSPRDALARLETMVLMAGIDLPVRAIREQIASAIDLHRAPRRACATAPAASRRSCEVERHGGRGRSRSPTSSCSTTPPASTRPVAPRDGRPDRPAPADSATVSTTSASSSRPSCSAIRG